MNNYKIITFVCAFILGIILSVGKEIWDYRKNKKQTVSSVVGWAIVSFVFSVLLGVCSTVAIDFFVAEQTQDDIEQVDSSEITSSFSSVSSTLSSGIVDGSSIDNNQINSSDTSSQLSEPDSSHENATEEVRFGTAFISPLNDSVVNNYNLYQWGEDDTDLAGNTYEHAVKIAMSNTIDAIFRDSNSISELGCELHLPYGGKAQGKLSGKVVVAAESAGNGSSADITITADGREIDKFSIDSASVEGVPYSLDLTGVQDVVFTIEATAVGTGFVLGVTID